MHKLFLITILLFSFSFKVNAATGYALDFDGTNDGVNMSSDTRLNVSTDNATGFTSEAWIYRKALSAGYHCILSRYNTVESAGYAMYINNNHLELWLNNGAGWVGPRSTVYVSSGMWHHVAITINSAGVTKSWLNGSDVTTSGGTGCPLPRVLTNQGELFSIGKSYLDEVFAGTIDEVRVSSVARYTTSFTPTTTPFTSDANTVGLWHMDENTGTTVSDSSVNKISGTFVDSPAWVSGKVDLPSSPSVTVNRAIVNDGAIASGYYYEVR